jgi:RHS repeat-associated protein
MLDNLGRTVTQSFVNNPAGQIYVNSSYDGLNRIIATTHPNFGSSDPNDVTENQQYDGLGRQTTVTHPDGQISQTLYGSSVAQLWGAPTTQQGSTSAYGLGFPVISIDEAGYPREQWLDGFGKVIEVDEPSLGATPGSGSVSVSGYERSGQFCPPAGPCFTYWDGGTVSVTVNGHTTSTYYGDCSQTQSNDTSATVAARLAAAINSDTAAYVTALYSSGSTMLLFSKTTGSSTNYTVTVNSVTDCQPQVFPPGSTSFPLGASGLSGGTSSFPTLSSPLVTNYTYDVLGNLTSVVQGVQARSWRYDGLSRLTQEATPEAGTLTLSYTNSSGALCSGSPSNVCTRTAPAPNQSGTSTVTTTYTYDKANRLTEKSYSDNTSTVKYAYRTVANGIGLLQTMTDSSGSEEYFYDKLKRITEVYKTIGTTHYTMLFAYNTAGELTEITYASGRKVYYNYDAVGHLCQIATSSASACNAGTVYLTIPSLQYDAAGRPLSAAYGNGITATAAYSPLTLQLTSLSYANTSKTLFGVNYYYQQNSTNCPNGNSVGDNGRIQCITDTVQPGRNIAYTYDALGRLLSAATSGSNLYPQWGLSETYDRYGNRSAQKATVGSGPQPSFTINPANNQITTFSYDAAGNVIGAPSSIATFAYDHEECNTGYTGGGSTATYTCDGNGSRVEKVVTGADAVTTVYIRLAGQVLAEYDSGAAVTSPTREYIYSNNLLAIVTGSTSGSGGTIVYQHRDHQSPRIYTDVNGNCVGDQGTYPFGELWYSNNDPNCATTASSSWIYTSYERDAESGDDYALSRIYANTEGRFMSPDPLEGAVGDPQSWNRYAYVRNDPVNLRDPSGQGFWEDLGFAIFDLFATILLGPEVDPILTVEEVGGETAGFIVITSNGSITLPWSAWGGNSKPYVGEHVHQMANGQWAPDGPDLPDANPTMPTCGGCADPGSGSGGDPGSQGPGSSGPSGSSSGGGTWNEGPTPGSTLPNGDVAVGMDIFRNSAACPGCGDLWGHAARSMNKLTIAYGVTYGAILAGPSVIGAAARLGGYAYGYLGTAGTVVLGSGQQLLTKAEELGGTALNAPNWMYNSLLRAGDWWTFNQAFLDGAIARGSNFVTITAPFSREAGGWLIMESYYLQSIGVPLPVVP